MKRLEQLRDRFGKRLTEEELRGMVKDLFPQFSDEVIKKAAKANRQRVPLGTISLVLGGLAGLIWAVNLPYPMIRRPVAKTAPILLLPSYLSMDRNYREAIAHVEQADRLVNEATSLADFELGEEKVKIAQKNLDALPVWFLGYEPQRYCSFVSCSWQFTLDEFEAARAKVGRMEATLFQEKNAMAQLEQSEATLEQSKQNYQSAATSGEKQTTLSAWQTSIDELNALPPNTLAAKVAQRKLQAYERDFKEVAGVVAKGNRSNTLINAAKGFANAAAKMSQNPPHPAATWQQCEELWGFAIQRLESVPVEDAGYADAQKLLATYRANLATIEIRRQAETEAVQALEIAQGKIERLLASVPNEDDVRDRGQIVSQFQGIVNQLSKVQPGTTAYEESQVLLQSARNKLKEWQ
ncbi:hypothetical protein [Lusitaniella coriacea]|nr:hypothetical protein [Lusitaniella coriacea]